MARSKSSSPIALSLTAFTLLVAVLRLPPAVQAQGTTGTIFGNVTDQSGAAVANAQVVAVNAGTGLRRTVGSNEAGEYRMELLPVGEYSIEASTAGFSKFIQKGVVLAATQSARVDMLLKPGSVSEQIEVTAAAPLVNTNNAEVGTTVPNVQVTQLPIVNRNVYSLLDITPGVTQNSNQVGLGLPEQHTSMNGSVEAGYSGSVNYYLDGGTNVGSLRNSGNILPNPDAIEEFRVMANNYSAEYGRFASGVISVITKSGSNRFHGSLFEFLRNDKLNAKDYASTIAKAPLRRNQFGATLGGAIKKDKTFFFGSYAGLRQSLSSYVSSAVLPTALERTGNFTQSLVKPTDPLTKQPFSCGGVVNLICANRFDPVALKMLNSYVPGVANGPGNTLQAYIPTPSGNNDFLLKIDHQLSDTQHLTGSYFETSGNQWINSGSSNIPYSRLQYAWRQQNLNLSHTWIASSNVVNQAWFVFMRAFGSRTTTPTTSLSDLGSTYAIQGAPNLPNISVSGYFNLSEQISGPIAGNNDYALRDLVSFMHGRHNFRFGAEESLNKDVQYTNLNNYGNFGFNGAITGNGLADFLIGVPSSVGQDKPVGPETNTWNTAFFIQDDYRLTPRLTVNLGLRWDIQTSPTDPKNRLATYVPGQQSTLFPNMPRGLVYPGDAGIPRGITDLAWNHVSPRLGFAWDPFGDGKTSVRAGAGLFWGNVSGNGWNQPSNFVPFTVSLSFPNASSLTGATLSDPYRNYPGGNPFPYIGQYITGANVKTIDRYLKWPYTYQMNFSLQRQLTKSLSATAAYVGSLGHNLPFLSDLNYPVLTASATNSGVNVLSRRPNPVLGQLQNMSSIGTSSYHSLQLSSIYRLSSGVNLVTNYVFSKTLTNLGIQNTTISAQDYNNLSLEAGRADTDIRHSFNLAVVWSLNYYRGNAVLQHLLNGWQISPIVKLRSGLPLTITNGVDANLDGNGTDRASLIGDPHLANPTAALWFNTAAFTQNKIVAGRAVDGTAGRNILDAPGYRDLDLGLARTFQIKEWMKLQFRAEASNALNTVNLNSPGTNVSTPSNFGIIRGANTMRQIQLGLRATF